MKINFSALTDDEVVASLRSLVGDERRTVASVLRHLNEFDRRRLAVGKGFPSLFEYCVKELKYAQSEAGRRIQVARASVKYPVLCKAIERGLLSLTVSSMLAPHLKWDNYRKLIRAAKGMTTREVEALIASLDPIPAGPKERIRFLTVVVAPPPMRDSELFASAEVEVEPASAAAASPAFNSPPTPDLPTAAEPVAAAPVAAHPAAPLPKPGKPAPTIQRVYFSFTGDEALWRDYERAKELSRHKWPAGKMEDVFSGAMRALLEKIDPDRRRRRKDRARRLAAGTRSRHIARAVKDEVWARDGGRCGYPGDGGRVCGARAGLQFDHVKPWALGGGGGAENVRLLCRAHNDLEARKAFGSGVIDAAISRRRGRLAEGAENI